MRSAKERLVDILQAIERIGKYAARGRKSFETDELVQTWVVHHLLIIGEAARALPRALTEKAPEIPWNLVVGARDILVHNYFGIDVDVVWEMVERDLPQLKRAVEKLSALSPPSH